jgi:hypothetical protein
MSDPRFELAARLVDGGAERCRTAFDELRPIVRLGRNLDPAAAYAATALVHMLARLHPHTTVDGNASLGHNPWGAADVAGACGETRLPRLETAGPATSDMIFSVGADGPADWWIGGGDWNVTIARHPAPIEPSTTGLGLHAAAALAAAEAFKATLGPLGFVHATADAGLAWNLLDHRTNHAVDPAGPYTAPPPTWWFGGGSVGSSSAALALTLPVPGIADVIDPDTFDPSRNPYRYPASTPTVTGQKTLWLAGMLAAAGWEATPHTTTVANFVASRETAGHDGFAISSVDRTDARADVADALARTTLSAGVAGLALHIQREHPNDDAACPYCQFLAAGSPVTQMQVYADMTGLRLPRIARLLAGDRLTADDVTAASAAGRLRPEDAPAFVDRRLEDLVRKAYAQAQVTVDTTDVLVSAPFVSWMAGTLLTAELAKAAAGVPLVDRRVDVDLSGVPTGAVRRVARDTSGRCLCASPFRQRHARQLYG